MLEGEYEYDDRGYPVPVEATDLYPFNRSPRTAQEVVDEERREHREHLGGFTSE